jgi:hypothetical protein
MTTPALTITAEEQEYEYKKTLGVSYELPGAAPSQELVSSLPYIFNQQIMSLPIPSTAPTDLIVDNSWTGGGTRSTSNSYNYIVYYYRVPLEQTINSADFAFVYNADITQNITTHSIPSLYDPGQSYAISIEANNNGNYTTVASSSGSMSWIFDTATGCVTFTTQKWTDIYNNENGFDEYPYITFWRYEGTFGSSEWNISGNNIYYNAGNVGIGTNNPGYNLDISGNIQVTGNAIFGKFLTNTSTEYFNVTISSNNVGTYGSGLTGNASIQLSGNNDYALINYVSSVIDQGYLQIGTGDNAAEPIYITTANGNTVYPNMRIDSNAVWINPTDDGNFPTTITNYGLNINGTLTVNDNSSQIPLVFIESNNPTNTLGILKVELTGANFLVYKDSSPSTPYTSLVNTGNGTIQIGSSASGFGNNLIVYGQVTATSFQSSSDYRLKTNIKQINNKYSIDNLNPVEYDMNDRHDMGFLAHEIQEYYPFLVDGDKDGEKMQSINYNGIIALLVKEIQVLKNEIKELKQKN